MPRNFGIIYGLIDSNKTIRYVGQTTQPVIHRYKQHLWYSIKQKNHLGYWINKNKETIKIKILEYCKIEEITKRELFWISKFDNLVNSMKGTALSNHHTHSDETKRKIGLATIRNHTGMKRTIETKNNISKSRKDFLKIKTNHPFYGKHHTEEFKRNQSIKVSKPVLQFTKTGDFIKEFNSITSAGKELNINIGNISACCRNKQPTAYGFIWKYKNNI